MVEVAVYTHVEDIIDFLVEDLLRQAEGGDLGADEAAGRRLIVEEIDLVAKRQQVAGDGQGGRAAADQGDFIAVFLGRDAGQEVL